MTDLKTGYMKALGELRDKKGTEIDRMDLVEILADTVEPTSGEDPAHSIQLNLAAFAVEHDMSDFGPSVALLWERATWSKEEVAEADAEDPNWWELASEQIRMLLAVARPGFAGDAMLLAATDMMKRETYSGEQQEFLLDMAADTLVKVHALLTRQETMRLIAETVIDDDETPYEQSIHHMMAILTVGHPVACVIGTELHEDSRIKPPFHDDDDAESVTVDLADVNNPDVQEALKTLVDGLQEKLTEDGVDLDADEEKEKQDA